MCAVRHRAVRHRAVRHRAAALVAAPCALGGCARRDPPPVGGATAGPRLAGVWTATFTLDTPPLGFDSAALRRAPGGRVEGTLAFVPNHWLTDPPAGAPPLPTPPTVYGSYDLNFGPFGFDTREADRVPDLVGTVGPAATARARPALVAVLGPTSGRGQVVLTGTVRGADSVTGTWRLVGPGRAAASATGRFVLVASTPARTGLGARVRAALPAGLGGDRAAGARR